MGTVGENLAAVRARIAAAARRVGRDPAAIRLVAVSKRVPDEYLRAAVAAGQRLFGENYLQEAEEKIARLDPAGELSWHFIGHLQSNKARAAAERFAMVETVDRLKLATLLDRQAAATGRELAVLLQVNMGGEEQKSGVAPAEAGKLLAAINKLPALRVMGLMTMPPWFADPEASRPHFRRLRLLAEELAGQGLLVSPGPPELSMGMSGDFEVAVEEGATLVRVGTAIFGPRS